MKCPYCNGIMVDLDQHGNLANTAPGQFLTYYKCSKVWDNVSSLSSPWKEGKMRLTERRSEFVYNAARLAAIASGASIIPIVWNEREQDFRDQFLKVIERQCGDQRSRSPEELHGSWMQSYFAMGWVYGEKYNREKRIHPDLVPYAQLGQLERDKDAVFVALCEIARQWIYD